MKLKTYFSISLCALLLLATASAEPPEPKTVPEIVTFRKGTIKIKKVTLNAEFAENNNQHQYGLMNRTKLPPNFGMLFIFENEEPRAFWMKNTFIDLSIAYIGANKKILEIIDMTASKSSTDLNPPSYPSKEKAKYALEVNKGWFKKNKIEVGDTIKYTIKK